MRICMILEGCYPYVRGGVSSWMQNYILGMPQHEFVLWLIGAESKNKGLYKYELPPNVVEIHEIFLDEAMYIPIKKKSKISLTQEEVQAHKNLIQGKEPDWKLLFKTYNIEKTNVNAFLMSEEFLDILLETSRKDYPFVAFSELFFTIRSILLPTLYVISQEIPKADVYHSSSTGYAGILGSMASIIKKRPYILTEHGIYSREREEEILRASWVQSYFKKLWITNFYSLARVAYETAISVTALFTRANKIQQELGCSTEKNKVIFNGVKTDLFINIPKKKENGFIDIGAVVRFHPIKDIKTMIYAFFELKTRVPSARLHILGDVDDQQYKDECLELINSLGVEDVIITGNVNIVEYMPKLDFTILTSISEGQPLSVLESLAAGRPCVTTDVGCCRELLSGETIDDFGRCGFVTKPMYAQEIANDMEFLCKHQTEREKMGEIGRQRILKSFKQQDIIKKYIDNYSEVLNQWLESDLS